MKKKIVKLGFFEKNMYIWVILSLITAMFIRNVFPEAVFSIRTLEYAGISLPCAVLLWMAIFSNMLKIDFSKVKETEVFQMNFFVNWLIRPFVVYIFSVIIIKLLLGKFIDNENSIEYISGIIVTGILSCGNMIYKWVKVSKLKEERAHSAVAQNILMTLILFIPITAVLFGISNIQIRYNMIILAILTFVFIPLIASLLVKRGVIRKKGNVYFQTVFIKKYEGVKNFSIIMTLILIFIYLDRDILEILKSMGFILLPMILCTTILYFITRIFVFILKKDQEIQTISLLSAVENNFEIITAVLIVCFGIESLALLVPILWLIIEVPLINLYIKISKKSIIVNKM